MSTLHDSEVPLIWVIVLFSVAVVAVAYCLLQCRRKSALLASRTAAYNTALKERDSIHQDLIERAGDGIVIVQNSIVLQANRRALEFSGRTREEVLGFPFSTFIPQDELLKVGEYYSRRMRGEDVPSVYETKLLHKSGTLVAVEISGGIVPMRGGVADLVLIRDITERKRHEISLRQYSAELEQANVQLRDTLVRANELAAKAEAANRAKTDFLSNMSHELRTPLTTIMGMIELLRDGAFGPLDEHVSESLSTVEASSQHLLDLINDILDIAKLESGRVELERRPVEIRALCTTCVAFLQQMANQKGVKLSVDCAAAPQKFWADGRRLRQILISLLGNAVKFTPEGGSAGLVVSSLGGGDGVKFTVWDTGVGIAADKIATLFQPFEQLDNTAGRPGGTGLGLALTKRLVALHGGKVEVQSQLGQGSQFIVSIPDPIARMSSVQSGQGVAGDLKGARILLAEDEATNASILQQQLQRRGAEVRIAVNGRLALESALAWKPGCILMDVQMPEMDGLTATRSLKASDALRDIPVICLTAFASEHDRRICMAHGADDYLPKPVDIGALVAKIAHHMHTTNLSSSAQ